MKLEELITIKKKINASFEYPHEKFNWLPYEKISLDFLKYNLNQFTMRFLKGYEDTLSQHKNFIVIVCKPSKSNLLFNSKIGQNEIIFPKIYNHEIVDYFSPVVHDSFPDVSVVLAKEEALLNLYKQKPHIELIINQHQ